jgi:hypothetical protein
MPPNESALIHVHSMRNLAFLFDILNAYSYV